MHKFFHFTHLKPIFSILHSHFYKTPTSVCLLYTFIQIKYSKPSHHQWLIPSFHQPDQYPSTWSILIKIIKTQPPSTHKSIPTDHYPSNKTDQTKNLKRIKVWCLLVRLDWLARLISEANRWGWTDRSQWGWTDHVNETGLSDQR